jgi:hypothetical protein
MLAEPLRLRLEPFARMSGSLPAAQMGDTIMNGSFYSAWLACRAVSSVCSMRLQATPGRSRTVTKAGNSDTDTLVHCMSTGDFFIAVLVG